MSKNILESGKEAGDILKKKDMEKACGLCEKADDICGGEYCICQKKGVVSPDYHCSDFSFDPLKIKVSARKLPEFIPDLRIK